VSELAITIGEKIRNLRLQRGISQEQLGEMADLHRTYIGQMERGEANITLQALEKVTGALGLTVTQLFRFVNPEEHTSENPTLTQIINAIQSRSSKDQLALLNVLNTILEWKDSSR
jgi:transcriptional regulator with XRE-family HTH domain